MRVGPVLDERTSDVVGDEQIGQKGEQNEEEMQTPPLRITPLLSCSTLLESILIKKTTSFPLESMLTKDKGEGDTHGGTDRADGGQNRPGRFLTPWINCTVCSKGLQP
jgi:hypothetical protein